MLKIKIEITGGIGSGKEALAREICKLLEKPFFQRSVNGEINSVQRRFPQGFDGLPVVEGPDDAQYKVIVHDLKAE